MTSAQLDLPISILFSARQSFRMCMRMSKARRYVPGLGSSRVSPVTERAGDGRAALSAALQNPRTQRESTNDVISASGAGSGAAQRSHPSLRAVVKQTACI